MFYFAWADKTDDEFGPEFQVEDEDVFSFSLSHAEGDYPSLDVDLRNPRVGLLGPGRKQWAWLSYSPDGDESEATPLFFGRMMGVPQELQNEIIRLSFVARPADWELQRKTLSDSMKVAPYYDPLWFSSEEKLDPDRVLEGYSRLWHIDRVTHEVTASDITNGEDGFIEFTADEVMYDSVSVKHSQSPVTKVIVEASVQWDQTGHGTIDITDDLIKQFVAISPDTFQTIDGQLRNPKGTVSVLAGRQLIDSWPEKGAGVGGGWLVGESSAEGIGGEPTIPTIIGDNDAYRALKSWGGFPGSPAAKYAMRDLFNSHPGYIVNVVDHTDPVNGYAEIQGNVGSSQRLVAVAHGKVDVMWVPIWRIAPKLTFDWAVTRERSETIQFEVVADLQPLLTDPDEDEVVRITLGPADVDRLISRKSTRYFQTDRGRRSFEHLLARARSIILVRARAVDVDFQVPFESAIGLSCRMNCGFEDPRLPGGIASGKVKGYTLSVDGDSGSKIASITMACMIGRGGTAPPAAGTPTYADGYVNEGYQEYDSVVYSPMETEDISYDSYTALPISDDGINLSYINKLNSLEDLDIEGGLLSQSEALLRAQPYGIGSQWADAVNGAKTVIRVQLRPLTGGPFDTLLRPTVSDLKVPQTINLEAS